MQSLTSSQYSASIDGVIVSGHISSLLKHLICLFQYNASLHYTRPAGLQTGLPTMRSLG